MKKGLNITFFLIILLVIPLISSVETPINIKTYPHHEVQIAVVSSSSTQDSIVDFKKISDEYGDVKVIFSTEIPKYDLYIYIKKDNEKLITNITYGLIPGEPLDLKLAFEGFEFIKTPAKENNSSNNINITNETKEQSIENKSSTGFTVFEGKGILSGKKIYYFGGALLIIGAILIIIKVVFVFLRMKKKLKEPKEIKVKKLSEINQEKDEDSQALEEAEKKIKEAQEEIKKIKEKSKNNNKEQQDNQKTGAP